MNRGTRIANGYVGVTVDGDGINEGIVDGFEGAGPGIERAGDEHGEAYGDHVSEGFFKRIRDKFGSRVASELASHMQKAGDRSGNVLGSAIVDSLRSRLSEENDRITGLLDRILSDNGRSDKRMTRLTTALAASERAAERLNKELTETLRLERSAVVHAERLNKAVSGNRGGGKDRDLGALIGGLFGAGSRNNALNLFGKTIGGVINLSESLFNSLLKFPSMLSRFGAGFTSAAEGASLFQKIGAGFGENGLALGKGLSAVAASGPGAAVALIAVAAAMTIMVSVANALLAVIVALTATIVSALVGALAVAAAGFTVLAGAVGLGVLAFMSMTDAQKDLMAGAFKPLHEAAIGLGQVMLDDLIPAFDIWSRNLQVALVLAYPLAQIMGGALAEAGSILTASFSGPGFALFIGGLTAAANGATVLDGIITHLSSSLGGFLNGMFGLFAAILPFVLQFSIYLDRVAKRFSDWSTSASGQNAITDFVRRALVSLASLWNFVTALGGLLAAVLFSPEGQKAGNNIFDRMANAVRRFTDYISREDRLEKWFTQGVTFAIALGEAIKTIAQILQRLNESGVIDGIARLVDIGAGAYDWFSRLPDVLQGLLFPLQSVADVIGAIGSALGSINPETGSINGLAGLLGEPMGLTPDANGNLPVPPPGTNTIPLNLPNFDDILSGLQSSGAEALAGTNLPEIDPDDLTDAQMAAYAALANSILANAPTYAEMLRKALRASHKMIAKAIKGANSEFAAAISDAALSSDAAGAVSAIQSVVESQTAMIRSTMQSLTEQAKSTVESAQSAVNAAAEQLKQATTKKAAKEALAALAVAQDQLAQAEKNQTKINRRVKKLRAAMKAANAIVAGQAVLTQANANSLASGFVVVNATLADYADARAQVAERLEIANQKLADAISVRDTFRAAITDAVNSFAALTTAQAKTIAGVEQALTANDITDNLQTKLDQIKKFQSNLKILLAQGLSKAAYKQILDAGVEQGGAFAQALVNGGQGSVQRTNSLVAQIGSVADQLGLEASNRMYQAGVDAAQGLVDGLTSLSAQLDSAAVALGNAIAAAVAKALGIASPSKVMFDQMETGVGEGLVKGLDAQHRKVGNAAARLSGRIAVSPEVASYAGRTGEDGYADGVSGNQPDPRFRDLVIQTPSTDPLAVGHEVLNEVVGRLP